MKKVYIINENDERLPDQTPIYDEMMILLKHRKPNAEYLSEDEEIFKLYDLLLLLRAGQLYIERTEDRFLMLTFNET